MNARECLELANADFVKPDQLYDFFSAQVPRLVVLYQKSERGKKPFLAKGNKPGRKFVVTFTDEEAARVVRVDQPWMVEMVVEPALPFLIKAYRSDADGIVFNPGSPSRFFLAKPYLLHLLREYAVVKLSQLPGAWVPTLENNLLLVEYQKGSYTVAIYASEKDAKLITQKSGGTAIRQPWHVILDRCRELGAPAPYLHYGLPEQTPLTWEHAEKIRRGKQNGFMEEEPIVRPFIKKAETGSVDQEEPERKQEVQPKAEAEEKKKKPPASLKERGPATMPQQQKKTSVTPYPPQPAVDPDVEAGLKKLEKATVEGQGMANGWEVCRAMAELRRIWVVVDPDGNMVILAGQDQSPIVDFFTSARHAQILIDEARRKNPNLPPMTPRLISTKKLYKALAPRQPIVWINRGSPEAWTSIMGDTLPYVLQLMSQLEREKT
ncbi:SseB family protein [Lihuaxuella thermophila]|uniref:SseB protein N-terminal domain-containing protein n=1 Tax=Lihuaxuella thermophila TaxID=1173111 RepID=A0A1H8AJ54_9BACL|nr:SseB family protein [Lihuaxuella thermophila]SEM69858.1 hypothetical protein SAMN05444955_101139 [Lihuaxuella thermophila]